MTVIHVRAVELVDTGPAEAGDDRFLVAVHAGSVTGWYGPISDAAADLIRRRLAVAAVGAAVHDHDRLLARLSNALGTTTAAEPSAAVSSGVGSWAIGALDCAVWDLHARTRGCTVADLLGARRSSGWIRAYGSWLRLDLARPGWRTTVQRTAAQHWRFTKWSLRPDPALPAEKNAQLLAGQVTEVRQSLGGPAAFDALFNWDPALLTRFAGLVDPTDLVWLEDPFAAHDRYPQAVAGQRLPVAAGERLGLGDDPRPLLAVPGLAAFTLDVVGCGGLTIAATLVARAAAAGIPVFPHGRSLLPALHLAAAFPQTVAAVEYQIPWEPRRRTLFGGPLDIRSGYIRLPQTAGFGPPPRRSS